MRLLITISFLILCLGGFSQYSTFGSAIPISLTSTCLNSPDCYRLTSNITFQTGSVWSNQNVDLSKSFDGEFCVYLGNANTLATCGLDMEDDGADGMVIGFKSLSAPNTGAAGGSLGIAGITPSVCVELDTYPNGAAFGDSINNDHTALVINGNVVNPIAGPITLMPGGGNAENGLYHIVRIRWNPNTFLFRVYFDGILKISHTQNFVASVFSNNPIVQVGVIGATGGCTNLQTICFPLLQVNVPDTSICQNDSAKISYYNKSLINYLWTSPLGDTVTYWDSSYSSPLIDTSIFVKLPGHYTLRVINHLDTFMDSLLVTVFPLPFINLGNDTLLCEDSLITLNAQNLGSNYLWNTGSTNQRISVRGENQFFVRVTDTNGCINHDTLLILVQNGTVDFYGDSLFGCEPLSVFFTQSSSVDTGSINQYIWDFGNGTFSNLVNDGLTYSSSGKYSVTLSIISDIGCVFDTNLKDYVEVFPFAIADFNVSPPIGKENVQSLFSSASANATIWSWDFGDGDISSAENPIKTYSSTGIYTVKLVISNGGGCRDSIIKEYIVIKSPTFFAPNSFTPNDDGVNDEWKITGLELATNFQLKIFNRWGKLIFSTSDINESWDGKYLNTIVKQDNYIYHAVINFGLESYERYGHILLTK